MFPFCKFYSPILKDEKQEQGRYYKNLEGRVRGCNLIFFDPDNGLQVKLKLGRKKSSKYLYWQFLKRFYKRGRSVLIYQHDPFEKRTVFLKRTRAAIAKNMKVKNVFALRTPKMVFFLVPDRSKARRYKQCCEQIKQVWAGQIF